jgi:nickel-dependent lactate racemase
MENRVELITSAWFGDSPIFLNFPSSWEITFVGNGGSSSLSIGEMKEKVKNPIGSQPLSDLASGKQRVAVIVDDITRPTPIATVLPVILEELKEGGVCPDSITIIIGGGTHTLPTEEEIEKKIGKELATSANVIPHDPSKDLVYLGKTSRGTPLHLNKTAFESDLLIGIGCIYPHPAAGFSGGSKIVAPGICGTETARYMHDYLKGGERGRNHEQNEFRKEIEEIATKAGLHFIVNVVLNQRREVCALFAGDKLLAHREGVEFATEMYSVKPMMDADVVVVDAYPFDTTMQFAHDRSFWQFQGLSRKVSKVIIATCPAGLGNHDLYPLKNPFATRLARRLKNLQWKEFRNPSAKFHALRKILERKKQDFLILTKGLVDNDMKAIYPKAKLYKTWEDVLRELTSRHKNGSVKVCIYRCSPFLLPVG